MENYGIRGGTGDSIYLLKNEQIIYICSMKEIKREFKDAHIYEDLLMFITNKFEKESERWK